MTDPDEGRNQEAKTTLVITVANKVTLRKIAEYGSVNKIKETRRRKKTRTPLLPSHVVMKRLQLLLKNAYMLVTK